MVVCCSLRAADLTSVVVRLAMKITFSICRSPPSTLFFSVTTSILRPGTRPLCSDFLSRTPSAGSGSFSCCGSGSAAKVSKRALMTEASTSSSIFSVFSSLLVITPSLVTVLVSVTVWMAPGITGAVTVSVSVTLPSMPSVTFSVSILVPFDSVTLPVSVMVPVSSSTMMTGGGDAVGGGGFVAVGYVAVGFVERLASGGGPAPTGT